jgi:hypothetical protein
VFGKTEDMSNLEDYSLPTAQQLQDLAVSGAEVAAPQQALRSFDRYGEALFFMPREIDGYIMGETDLDDYYWCQRFIGRIGVKGDDGMSLRVKETATTINDALGLTDKERIYYCVEWNGDEVIKSYLYDLYDEGTSVDFDATEANWDPDLYFLYDKNMADDDRIWEPRPFTAHGCQSLLQRMQEFSIASLAMHYRSLGVSDDIRGRVGFETAITHALTERTDES